MRPGARSRAPPRSSAATMGAPLPLARRAPAVGLEGGGPPGPRGRSPRRPGRDTMRLAPAFGLLSVLAVTVLAPATARAGNDDSFFQGNEAAMLGGAVAAVGYGPGLLWYNPAGLGSNTRNRLELSGSVFTLRIRRLDPFVRVGITDEQTIEKQLRGTSFVTAPSALSFVRQLSPRLTAGFGVFVPVQESFDAGSDFSRDVAAADGRSISVSGDVAQTVQRTRYHAGPGFGYRVSDRFRIGASLFFVYETASLTARINAQDFRERAGDPSLIDSFATGLDVRANVTRMALELVLGAQWEPVRGFHLGFAVRGPRFRLKDEEEYDDLFFQGTDTTDISDPENPVVSEGEYVYLRDRSTASFNDVTSPLAAPMRFVFGVGYSRARLRMGVEVDVSHQLLGALIGYERQWNARFGVAFRVSDETEIGMGLFTDRAATFADPLEVAAIDYYGASLGLKLDTPVGLSDDEQEESGASRLVFRTTVGLRYAVGIGDWEPFEVDLTEDGTMSEGGLVDVIFHEVGLYLGSGLDF
ncbi:MAG: hypothetical protein CMN29_29245 [Sandaracinus sp.]|nr:hypothetical protein [Sandaracinus sp.]